ncbi:MAG TPA: ABC transporter permease [Candidatus Dormibacteraeota bacterium]|nr:ABC transporter permease [Candidatus Dormibacteraeota bacterium]
MGVAPIDRLTGLPAVAVPVRGRRGRIAAAAVTVVETFRLALDALRAHKLRSFLTLLGVILAVATLVAVMSVVAGLNFYVADRVANLGANVYLVDRFGIITSQDAWVKAQKRPLVTIDEYQRLRENMKTAVNVAATDDRVMDVRSGNILLESTDLTGVTPNYAEIRNMNLSAGRFLTEGDDLHHSPVCFIGTDVLKKFFPTVDPIGKAIRAGTNTYEVVGVATEIGSAFGQSQDNYILIPFSTYYKDWHKQNDWLTIFVQAQNAEIMQASEDEARMLMRAWRHLPYDAPDNFAVFGSASIMALWNQITGNLFAVAVALTAVFLVVGGIVIMNIMLASVTERTREIGLRRSLGARRKHIVLQFMTESAVLAAVGGIMGLTLAYGIVALVRAVTPIPVKTPLSAVIISLSVSTAVGLFFGIYPAMRAAKLDPIEALRADG